MGDNLSFGITAQIRDANPDFYAEVDKCSGAYTAGQWTGEALQAAMGGAAGWKAAGKAAFEKNGKKYVMDFSHAIKAEHLPGGRGGALDNFLTKTKLNGNYVTPKRHYKHDPEYFGNMEGWKKARWRKEFGDKWPAPLQALDRIPKFPAGALLGANAGDASRRNQTGGCP